jgi:hypothetical protein
VVRHLAAALRAVERERRAGRVEVQVLQRAASAECVHFLVLQQEQLVGRVATVAVCGCQAAAHQRTLPGGGARVGHLGSLSVGQGGSAG